MEDNPLISIIIPVYNVEKYLRHCLDSVINQTYKNIEILIIDDGSSDRCGEICDEYAYRDRRVRVFHTENSGLSAARNLGLDEAHGAWIQFIDSDDWVDEKFCEIPLKAAIENDADLVIFPRINTTERGKVKRGKRKNTRIGVISHEGAIEFGDIVVWNKLYRRNLFTGIRYPAGHVYEDYATTHKLVYGANHIEMLLDSLVYHRVRRNSISQTKTLSAGNDIFCFSIQRYQDLIRMGYPEVKARRGLQHGAFSYCINVPYSPADETYKKAENIISEIKGIPKYWTCKRRLLFALWKMNRRLFYFTCGMFQEKSSERQV